MATILLGAAGSAVAGGFGGSLFGIGASAVGRAAGSAIGRSLDRRLLTSGSEPVDHGPVDRIRVTSASEGSAIPRIIGRTRVAGQIIWTSPFSETRSVTNGRGKGAARTPGSVDYSYSVSFATALCEGEVTRVGRIWADGKEIARNSLNFRLYPGTPDQLPDALIEALDGRENCPAYRGVAYVVIEDLDLGRFGNRIPNLTFEVVRIPKPAKGQIAAPAHLIQGVALIPGSGEYSLAMDQVHYDYGLGEKAISNEHTVQDATDFHVAIENLVEELPNLKSVSLIVCWFGDDLRCSHCTIRPAVEQRDVDGSPMSWTVAGTDRRSATLVPRLDGSPVYGGTPSDESVVQAIRHLKSLGLDVTLYPFILMHQLGDNELPNPYGGNRQPELPWRGRITSDVAHGLPGSSDGTIEATAQVEVFFGSDTPMTVSSEDAGAAQGKENDLWRYNRFILHYANLCAEAGGVEAFCIGSEMRGLTRIRGPKNSFPAVEKLKRLATTVKEIIPDSKIGYAADWSEYFGYHPTGSEDVFFNLDPLWSDKSVDFVGIDNYMPMSDWRDDPKHLDSASRSEYNLKYLKANIEGGEGYDWYYASEADRISQRRTRITDGRFDEPWVFGYKNIRAWWSNEHFDRVNGERSAEPSNWKPRSKPIRFTEYGCPAVNKGTNQPNKFVDVKSSESALPYFSNGQRDDLIQAQYIRAFTSYWAERNDAQDDVSSSGPMIDLEHSFAWAWDARPWPTFPEVDGIWSDRENYTRGHWLTGRASSVPLEIAVTDICKDLEIDDIDLEQVTGIIDGYLLPSLSTVRSEIQPLALATGLESFCTEDKLVFKTRRKDPVISLKRDELIDGSDNGLMFLRGSKNDRPSRIVVNYTESSGDFQVRSLEVKLLNVSQMSSIELDLPVQLSQSEAYHAAERLLGSARLSDETLSLWLAQSYVGPEIGDIIKVDGAHGQWYVDSVGDTMRRKVEASRIDQKAFIDRDGALRLIPKVPASPHLPVEMYVLDIPTFRRGQSSSSPFLACFSEPWPKAVSVFDSSSGRYEFVDTISKRSSLGRLETKFLYASPGVPDRSEEILIRLAPGSTLPRSVTNQDLHAGENIAAVGNGSTDDWELFQFRNVRLVADHVVALSYRLRGRRGTEEFVMLSRDPGNFVIFLNDEITQASAFEADIGSYKKYRYGPASLFPEHSSFRTKSFKVSGNGLRPLSPVHVRRKTEPGKVTFSWIRRSRSLTDQWDALDVPLGEEGEKYQVHILDVSGNIVFSTTVNSPEWTSKVDLSSGLSNDERELFFTVSQISEYYGIGTPSTPTKI